MEIFCFFQQRFKSFVKKFIFSRIDPERKKLLLNFINIKLNDHFVEQLFLYLKFFF